MCGQPVGWLGFNRFFLIIVFVHLPGGGGNENDWLVIWPFLNPEIPETATFIFPKDSPFF
jgi:hypothetical protein